MESNEMNKSKKKVNKKIIVGVTCSVAVVALAIGAFFIGYATKKDEPTPVVEKTYTVVLESNEGKFNSNSTNIVLNNVKKGTVLGEISGYITPSHDLLDFSYWFGKDGKRYDVTSVINDNAYLVAQFTKGVRYERKEALDKLDLLIPAVEEELKKQGFTDQEIANCVNTISNTAKQLLNNTNLLTTIDLIDTVRDFTLNTLNTLTDSNLNKDLRSKTIPTTYDKLMKKIDGNLGEKQVATLLDISDTYFNLVIEKGEDNKYMDKMFNDIASSIHTKDERSNIITKELSSGALRATLEVADDDGYNLLSKTVHNLADSIYNDAEIIPEVLQDISAVTGSYIEAASKLTDEEELAGLNKFYEETKLLYIENSKHPDNRISKALEVRKACFKGLANFKQSEMVPYPLNDMLNNIPVFEKIFLNVYDRIKYDSSKIDDFIEIARLYGSALANQPDLGGLFVNTTLAPELARMDDDGMYIRIRGDLFYALKVANELPSMDEEAYKLGVNFEVLADTSNYVKTISSAKNLDNPLENSFVDIMNYALLDAVKSGFTYSDFTNLNDLSSAYNELVAKARGGGYDFDDEGVARAVSAIIKSYSNLKVATARFGGWNTLLNIAGEQRWDFKILDMVKCSPSHFKLALGAACEESIISRGIVNNICYLATGDQAKFIEYVNVIIDRLSECYYGRYDVNMDRIIARADFHSCEELFTYWDPTRFYMENYLMQVEIVNDLYASDFNFERNLGTKLFPDTYKIYHEHFIDKLHKNITKDEMKSLIAETIKAWEELEK